MSESGGKRAYNGCRGRPQESPHFEDGLISALFGPHVERMGSPKADECGDWRIEGNRGHIYTVPGALDEPQRGPCR